MDLERLVVEISANIQPFLTAIDNVKASILDIGTQARTKMSNIVTNYGRNMSASAQIESARVNQVWEEAFRNISDLLTGFREGIQEEFGTVNIINGAREEAEGRRVINVFGAIRRVAAGVKTAFSNITAPLRAIGTKLLNSVKKIFSRIYRMTVSTLLFSVLMRGFSALRNKIGDILKGNKDLAASLAKFKGAVYTAFQPILEYAIPIIKQLIDWLTALFSKLAVFTARIFGKTVNETAAAAKAMGDLADETERTVLGFDELNKLNGNNTNTVGVDYSAVVEGGKDAADIWAKLKLQLKNLFDWLKDKFLELPSYVSGIATKIANGFAEIDFGKIGSYMGEVTNRWAKAISDFFTKTNFQKIGEKINDFITEFIRNTDWEAVAKSAFDGIKGLVNLIKGFLKGKDGKGIDWYALNKAFVDTAMQSLESLLSSDGVLWDVIDAISLLLDNLINSINAGMFSLPLELGSAIGSKIIEGVVGIITGDSQTDMALADWLDRMLETVGKAILNAIKGIATTIGTILDTIIFPITEIYNAVADVFGWDKANYKKNTISNAINEWFTGKIKEKYPDPATPHTGSSGVEHVGGGMVIETSKSYNRNAALDLLNTNGAGQTLTNAMAKSIVEQYAKYQATQPKQDMVIMLDGQKFGYATVNSINNITKQSGQVPLYLLN